MEKKNYYTDLILRYLADEIGPIEERELKIWLEESDEHQKLFVELQSNWNADLDTTQAASAAFQRLADRLELPDDRPPEVDKKLSIRKPRVLVLKIAASLTGLLLIASVFYYLLLGAGMTIHTTGYGETATLLLPDSSVVTLNANSSLEYDSKWFGGDHREVWLRGEAYFQVKKSRLRSEKNDFVKFIVHAHQMDVEVVGTQFNVNDRRGKTTVVLSSGSVVLNSDLISEESLMMQPGDLIQVSAGNDHFVKKIVNPEIYSSWKEKKMILNNTTAGEIAQIVEDYYGVKVLFESDSLAEKTLTGSIPNHSLDAFLTIFSASIGVEIERKRNQLILRNKISP